MSWLDNSNNSNKFKQTYVQGFVDISGGDLTVRTGNLNVTNFSNLNSSTINGNLSVTGQVIVSGNAQFQGTRIDAPDIYCSNIYGNIQGFFIKDASYVDLYLSGNAFLGGNVIIGTNDPTNLPKYAFDMTQNKFSFSNYGNTWNDTRTPGMYSFINPLINVKMLDNPNLPFTSNSLTVTSITGTELFRNGTYSVSAFTGNSNAYKVFDLIPSTSWLSVSSYTLTNPYSYIGTAASTSYIQFDGISTSISYGEYIQINLPYSAALKAYSLVTDATAGFSRAASWVLLGQNPTDVSWNLIDVKGDGITNVAISPNTDTSIFVVTDANTKPNTTYTNFRIVFTNFQGGRAIISQWNLSGDVYLDQSKFVSYSGISISTTGQYQSISVTNGNLYLSQDYGSTWKDNNAGTTNNQLWSGISISSTGQYQTAVVDNSGDIYTSDSYGSSWTDRSNINSWKGIMVSSDGRIQTAVPSGGNIYTSANYGQTWLASNSGAKNWSKVDITADGTIQAATVSFGNIWLSTDSGLNWSQKSPTGSNEYWSSVTMSYNGSLIAADVSGGNIYISNDIGSTWNNATGQQFGNQRWSGLATSSTGQYITAQTVTGNIYISKSFGQAGTWKNQTGTNSVWYDQSNNRPTVLGNTLIGGQVAISATGQTQTVMTSGGNIYISTDVGSYPTNFNMVVKGLSNGGGGISQTFDKLTGDTQSYINIVTTDVSYAGGAIGGGVDELNKPFLSLNVNSTGNYSESARAYDSYIDINGVIKLPDDSVILTNLPSLDFNNIGTTWTNVSFDATNLWLGICMSANGQYQSACSRVGGIYRSIDYGQNWLLMPNTTGIFWNHISMSAGGNIQMAVAGRNVEPTTNGIYRSTDYGQTWSIVTGIELLRYIQICVSADGKYQTTMGKTNGKIYRSTDYGLSWSPVSNGPVSTNWSVICMSANGQYQTIASTTSSPTISYIYRSTDYGINWSLVKNITKYAPGNGIWSSISMSSNGQYQTITLTLFGPISTGYPLAAYVSNDYGVNWTQHIFTLVSASTGIVCMSSSGRIQFICSPVNTTMFLSNDYGVNWTTINTGLSFEFSGICMSSTGQYMSACANLNSNGTTNGIFISNIPYPTINSSGDGNFKGTIHVGGPIILPDNTAIITHKPALDYNNFGNKWTYYFIPYIVGNTYSISGFQTYSISATGQYGLICNLYPPSYNTGYLIRSTDYGQTWTQITSTGLLYWYSNCVSASGKYQSAVVAGGSIYRSENYGITWAIVPGTAGNLLGGISWSFICMSANGKYQVAVGYGSTTIYYSDNYGVKFQAIVSNLPTLTWTCVALSTNGQYQTACSNDAISSQKPIYKSTDYGNSWSAAIIGDSDWTTDGSGNWTFVCMSANGQYQWAITEYGLLYSSQNYGFSWQQNTSLTQPTEAHFRRLCISADGQFIATCGFGSRIYLSNDYGVSFSEARPAGDSVFDWNGICMSANGQYISSCKAIDYFIYSSIVPYPNIYISGAVVADNYIQGSYFQNNQSIPRTSIFYNDPTDAAVQFRVVNNTAPSTIIRFQSVSSGTPYGSISTSGGNTAYNTASDYRLKENIVTLTNNLSRIDQLKPCKYNMIGCPGIEYEGFLAHEVQEILPFAVSGEKDAFDGSGNIIVQQIDTSFLIPLLTGAIQELREIIKQQQTQIDELVRSVAPS
jgi:hypothetical protein